MGDFFSRASWLLGAASIITASVAAHAASDANRERLLRMQPIVVSYYWPMARNEKDARNLTMQTPNVIDVPAGVRKRFADAIAYWDAHGKVILNRVHPFKPQYGSAEAVYANLSAGMEEGDGISIDEVVAHSWSEQQRDYFQQALCRLRKTYPAKLIFVWDASRWQKATAPLARKLDECADVIMLEIYLRHGAKGGDPFRAFGRRMASIDRFAPGIRKKTIVGIGTTHKQRAGYSKADADGNGNGNGNDNGNDEGKVNAMVAADGGARSDPGFGDYLADQVRFIRANAQSDSLRGLAIYAPIYLDRDEQRKLDDSLHESFKTGERQQ
jgi:hypothetical protein